jgi:pimeloyl-ACP methyl ester carboxylesterase
MTDATPLPSPLAGERLDLQGPAGRVAAFVSGSEASRPPLLLVHSVNAAATAAEVRPVFDHARATRCVMAIDLPGFGLSDRSDRAYSPRLMTDAVLQAAQALQARCGGQAVDVLGVSLGCEFVARAASELPALFRRVALVSPTGLRGTKARRGPPGSVIGPPWVLKLLKGPGWGAPLFRGLTRPDVIAYFLRRTWGSRDIDQALWRYDVLTTRVPGAEHAPLHFLAARLFSADITTIYEALTQPVWMSHGTRGDFTDYRGKTALLQQRPNWHCTVFPETGALMYFERPDAFHAALDAFLGEPRAPSSPA